MPPRAKAPPQNHAKPSLPRKGQTQPVAMPELFAPRLFPLSRNATPRANGFLPLLPCPHGLKVLKGPMLNSLRKKHLLLKCVLFPVRLLCPPAHVRRSPPAVKVATPVPLAATTQAAPPVKVGMHLAEPQVGNALVVLVAQAATAPVVPVAQVANAPVVLVAPVGNALVALVALAVPVGSAPWVPAQLPAAVPRLLLPLPRLIANRAAKSATRVAAP